MSPGLMRGETVGRKKSEERKHTALVRVSDEAHETAILAASLMKMSLADYVSRLILSHGKEDIQREARKLTGGSPESAPKPKPKGKGGER